MPFILKQIQFYSVTDLFLFCNRFISIDKMYLNPYFPNLSCQEAAVEEAEKMFP